jgi:murein DD-endopeptidase MepM/ murein hydrolase activator NlpD
MLKRNTYLILICLIGLNLGLGGQNSVVRAVESADQIRDKIDKRSSDIAQLEKEIASYQKQIDALSSQSATLQSTIKTLQLTRQKLEKNIALTQDKITAKSYDIQKLEMQISGKEGDINDSQRIISKTFATINEIGTKSMPALVLGSRSVSDTLDSVEQISALQEGLYDKIDKLSKDKASLETNKKASEKAKADLLKLNNQLSNERALILSTANEQAEILKETSDNEANYKKLLATKKEEALAFQKEINSYESQLKILIDPKLLPSIGTSVLSWPLDNVFITQRYGRTDFSVTNKQFYKDGSHNGMDLRAAIGTPVRAAREGVIAGVGNTDVIKKCKSYGRWVLVKHDNGLSTIYAHLSLPSVVVGQKVDRGEIIAYSGSTGAATGPHLHFGLYASQGLQVLKITKQAFPSVVNCINSVIPVGKTLDPSDYL